MALKSLAVLLVMACLGAAQTTSRDPALPVSFQGSALLITYYSGVAAVLLNNSVIVPGSTPLSGLSGGAITSTLSHLGLSGEEQRDMFKKIIGFAMRSPDKDIGHLNEIMGYFLFNTLPDDVAEIVNGNLRVALSQLDSNRFDTLNGSASWVVDEWSSKADLQSCLMSTDYIPCFTGNNLYKHFRNQPVIDGGYANGFEDLCPPGTINSTCLKVSSWHVGEEADNTCDLERCPTGCTSDERTPESKVYTLYEAGEYVDQRPLATVFERCPGTKFSGYDPYPLPPFVPHHSTMPDIFPGKWNDLPEWDGKRLLVCEWQGWSMGLPAGREMEVMDLIYEQGVKDATSWLDEVAV